MENYVCIIENIIIDNASANDFHYPIIIINPSLYNIIRSTFIRLYHTGS